MKQVLWKVVLCSISQEPKDRWTKLNKYVQMYHLQSTAPTIVWTKQNLKKGKSKKV